MFAVTAFRPPVRGGAFVACFLLATLAVAPADAQTAGCTPGRTLANGAVELDCGAGLVIVVERDTRYRLEGEAGQVDRLVVDRGAALVEFDRSGGFQIQTPRAVASVRGTTWAVDVTPAATAVLTVEGAVNVVPRVAGGSGVVLRAGEGADVTATSTRLTAIRWGAGRVQRLLARLGR